MLRQMKQLTILMLLVFLISTPSMMAQNITKDIQYDDENYDAQKYGYDDRSQVDRYLDVEVWTNHNDGEYYEGDNIVIHYRVNRDSYVVIYSIDTKGRVNILFPTDPTENNYVEAGISYRMPNNWDDYELVVSGPEGVENIQIIASRERIPIPDWYPVSGLICDWDDRYEFMDYINDHYFVRNNAQRLAYDRTSIYVDEWEDYYFEPVYHPVYHNWTLCGNVYFDYPWGSTVYIDGIYWGFTPLYLPRIYVGWHTFTVYDPWGYCWESDIHISRYNTIVLDNNIVQPGPHIQSKFKDVRVAGYKNPVKSGYVNFETKKASVLSSKDVTKKNVVIGTDKSGKANTQVVTISPKKNVRGSTAMIKTDRGWEASGIGESSSTKGNGKISRQSGVVTDFSGNDNSRTKGEDYGSYNSGGTNKPGKTSVTVEGSSSDNGNKSPKATVKTQDKSSTSSGFYQKKTGDKGRKSSTYDSGSDKSKESGKSTRTYKESNPSTKSSTSSNSGSSVKSNKQSSGKSSGSSGSSGNKGSSGQKSSSGGSKSNGKGK